MRRVVQVLHNWAGPGLVAICDDGAMFAYELRQPTEGEIALVNMHQQVQIPYIWRELPPVPGTKRASDPDAVRPYEPPPEHVP